MTEKPIITLLAVTSLDGYIAKHSGHAPATWASPEEQDHFLTRMDQMDWSVMGRVTHEAAFRPNRKRVVFSTLPEKPEWRTENHLWLNPDGNIQDTVMDQFVGASSVALLGGTRVHDWFLERNLIDVIELSVEPVVFGAGLPLFWHDQWSGFQRIDEIIPAMAKLGFDVEGGVRALNMNGTKLMRFFRQK